MHNWPHAPTHRFNQKGSYIVTGATLHKEPLFKKDFELDFLQNMLLELANHYQWFLEAWAIFPNHYHFVAQSPSLVMLFPFAAIDWTIAALTMLSPLRHIFARA